VGIVSKILNFLDVGIWRINSRRLPKRKSLLLRQLRIFVLSKRGFDEDKCALQASALTYYTLMSIVPIVAMAFGIANAFAAVLIGAFVADQAGTAWATLVPAVILIAVSSTSLGLPVAVSVLEVFEAQTFSNLLR